MIYFAQAWIGGRRGFRSLGCGGGTLAATLREFAAIKNDVLSAYRLVQVKRVNKRGEETLVMEWVNGQQTHGA